MARISAKLTELILALMLINSFCAFAEDGPTQEESAHSERDEKKFAVGLGLEFNMNSPKRYAGGVVLGFDYNLPYFLAVGFTAAYSNNFFGFSVMEPAALFRWYFLGKKYTGFFAQADIGASLIFERGALIPMFLGGLRGGYRFPLGSSFYVEPFGRLGYPFAFGIGVIAGIRLPVKKRTESPNEELAVVADIVEEISVEPDAQEVEQTEPEVIEAEQVEPESEEAEQAEPEAQEVEHTEPDVVEAEQVKPEAQEVEQTEPDVVEAEQIEPEEVPVGKYYIVRQGDTLSQIALREYGDAFRWREIADANPGIKNPHLIYPNQELYIPPDVKRKE